jgi:hypothetical protein
VCAVKKPKVKSEKPKELPILRNPILDGMLGNIAAIRNGRNAFRINLINPLTIPVGGGPSGNIGGGSGSTPGGTSGGTSGGSSGGTSGGTSGGSFSGSTSSAFLGKMSAL